MKHNQQLSDKDTARRTRRRLTLATAAAGGAAALGATIPFVVSMGPSERARSAAAPVPTDIGHVLAGQLLTVEWRGKPVWILRRTDQMIKELGAHDSLLLDPLSARSRQPADTRNVTRSLRPEYLVAIGLCTHLGCIPTMRQEIASPDLGPQWPGGFFCPCHGSKFDFAGRVFRNVPAPTNLEIPPHTFLSDTRVLIGAGEFISHT